MNQLVNSSGFEKGTAVTTDNYMQYNKQQVESLQSSVRT